MVRGGVAGQFTKEEGIYSYYEVCDKLNIDGWKRTWDDRQQSLYATHYDQWVGFDNQRSIALKVKWAYTMSLGGTMFWTLDFDDYTGKFCNEGPFPLANAIKSIFDEYAPPTTAQPAQTPAKKLSTTSVASTSSSTGVAKERAGANSTSSKMGYINIKGNNITFVRNGNLMRNYNSSMLANNSSSQIYFQNRRSSSTANNAPLLASLSLGYDLVLSQFLVFRFLFLFY